MNDTLSDEDLKKLKHEAEVFSKVVDALEGVPPERRLRVLRAASILVIGNDIAALSTKR